MYYITMSQQNESLFYHLFSYCNSAFAPKTGYKHYQERTMREKGREEECDMHDLVFTHTSRITKFS